MTKRNSITGAEYLTAVTAVLRMSNKSRQRLPLGWFAFRALDMNRCSSGEAGVEGG